MSGQAAYFAAIAHDRPRDLADVAAQASTVHRCLVDLDIASAERGVPRLLRSEIFDLERRARLLAEDLQAIVKEQT